MEAIPLLAEDGSPGQIPQEYSGKYATFNLPYHFLNVVNAAIRLRQTLNNQKYKASFETIQKALREFDDIIFNNNANQTGGNTDSAIDLKVSSLSGAIQTAIGYMVLIKKGKKNIPNLLTDASELAIKTKEIVEAFKAAWGSGDQPPKKPCNIPRSSILGWIDALNETPSKKNKCHLFAHTFTYSPKLSAIAGCFIVGCIASTAQSIFDYTQNDSHLPATERSPAYVHYTIPVIFGFLAITCAIAAYIDTHCLQSDEGNSTKEPSYSPTSRSDATIVVEFEHRTRDEIAEDTLAELKKLMFTNQPRLATRIEAKKAALREHLRCNADADATLSQTINTFFEAQGIPKEPAFAETTLQSSL
jgi:hypothetical protein